MVAHFPFVFSLFCSCFPPTLPSIICSVLVESVVKRCWHLNSSKEASFLLGRGRKLPHSAVGQVLPAARDVFLAITGQLKCDLKKY